MFVVEPTCKKIYHRLLPKSPLRCLAFINLSPNGNSSWEKSNFEHYAILKFKETWCILSDVYYQFMSVLVWLTCNLVANLVFRPKRQKFRVLTMKLKITYFIERFQIKLLFTCDISNLLWMKCSLIPDLIFVGWLDPKEPENIGLFLNTIFSILLQLDTSLPFVFIKLWRSH